MSVRKLDKGWAYQGKIALPGQPGIYQNYYKSGFKTKKEAVEAERTYRIVFSNPPKQMALGLVIDEYMQAYKSRNLKHKTYVSADSEIRNAIYPYFDRNTVIQEITWKDLVQWHQALIDKGYSKNSQHNFRIRFNSILRYAYLRSYIPVNPMNFVPYPGGRKEWLSTSHEIKYWKPEEFEKVLENASSKDMELIFCLGFWAGLRVGEVRALTWDCLDLEKRTLRIEATITDTPEPSVKLYRTYDRVDPKTYHSFRTIDISGILTRLFAEKLEHDKKIIGWKPDSYIFGTESPFPYDRIADNLDRSIRAAGVKRITFHGLRHSHASWLIFNKVPDPLIAERLGHTIETLRSVYAHIYEQTIDEFLALMDIDECQIPDNIINQWKGMGNARQLHQEKILDEKLEDAVENWINEKVEADIASRINEPTVLEKAMGILNGQDTEWFFRDGWHFHPHKEDRLS